MKKAFSLIELMIVIVIIGVIYTLAVTKLKSVGEEEFVPTLANLKEYLLSLNDDAQKIELICLDDCSECSIYKDDVKIKTMENFLDESIESYRYDFLQGLVRKKERVFFNDEGVQESVCFSFAVDASGVSDQVIVLYKDKAYDYTSYFKKTEVYDYLEEVVEAKEILVQEVMQ